jgi:hypothetical protein
VVCRNENLRGDDLCATNMETIHRPQRIGLKQRNNLFQD